MNHNGHLCVWMATTTRSNSCRPLRALTSERNSCCFAGRCSLYLARKRGRDSCESHGELPHQAACVCGGGRVARLFCQRGGALEGLVGPCEAGARTAAPAQEAGSSTAQREKRQETVCISALDSDVWAFLLMRGNSTFFFGGCGFCADGGVPYPQNHCGAIVSLLV